MGNRDDETGEKVDGEYLPAALSPSTTEAAEVAELALAGTVPEPIEPGQTYVLPDGRGRLRVVNTDEYAEHPRHVAASRTVTNAKSFVEYIEKHGLESTEVWADTKASTVQAIIDAHEGAGKDGGWQKHRLQLALQKSNAWLAWESLDGKLIDQLDFAEFIEARAIDVVDPSSASLLDMARSFHAHKTAAFDSGENPGNGEIHFTLHETVTAKAGQKGDMTIPERIHIVVAPFVNGPRYNVWARFRYRLNGGVLTVGYVLERPAEILEAAFADVVTDIREGKVERVEGQPDKQIHAGITQPIFYGRSGVS